MGDLFRFLKLLFGFFLILNCSSSSIPETKVMVFFHGGGWVNGSINQMKPWAKYYFSKGYDTMLVNYSTFKKNGGSPFDALNDARAALKHAKDNYDEVIAVGTSAGGQLAASSSNLDHTVDILILFNPILDNGPDGYGYDRIGESYIWFSPYHTVTPYAPPTLIMSGTEDPVVSPLMLERYSSISGAKVVMFEGETHGFFNKKVKETISVIDCFLDSL